MVKELVTFNFFAARMNADGIHPVSGRLFAFLDMHYMLPVNPLEVVCCMHNSRTQGTADK